MDQIEIKNLVCQKKGIGRMHTVYLSNIFDVSFSAAASSHDKSASSFSSIHLVTFISIVKSGSVVASISTGVQQKM